MKTRNSEDIYKCKVVKNSMNSINVNGNYRIVMKIVIMMI